MSRSEPVRTHARRAGADHRADFSRGSRRLGRSPLGPKTYDFIGPLQPRERRQETDQDRFWSKVERGDGCWHWRGAAERSGYGSFRFRGRAQRAHRVSWVLTNGTIAEGMHVLHRCDNPACVRPDHLFLGTHQDNMDDKSAKGRCRGPAKKDGAP